MITNGAVNFPSSQLLYLIVGYFVSTGDLLLVPSILIGSLGNTIGNAITFLLIKKHGRPLAQKLLLINKKTFDTLYTTLHETFTERGMWWIFIGKLTPSVKAFIPIVSGLAKTPNTITLCIFGVASVIWATGVTLLGYYFGEHVSLTSFATVSLLIGITLAFVLYKKFSKTLYK